MVWGRSALSILAWAILCLLALPVFVVVPLSFSSVRFFAFPPPGWSLDWYANLATSREWHEALLTSLGIGAGATVLSLALGAPAAVALVRYRFAGRGLLHAVLLSPLIIPTIILAIGLYYAAAPLGLVGRPWAIALVHVVLAMPYVLVTLTAALERLDPSLERAAQSLGASPVHAFWLVTVPLIRPSVLSAAFLAFLASFDDLVVGLFLSGSATRTIQIQMWQGIRFESDPTIAAMSSVLIAAALAGFALLQAQGGRPEGSHP